MATNVTKSTLAEKILDKKINDKLIYKPYADIGIVEDNVELLLKEKSVGGSHYEDALKSLEGKDGKKVEYNNLAQFYNDVKPDEIILGFMQNDASKNELAPAWNATPVDVNGTGKWYQDRLDKWAKDGLLKEKLTISFGPFGMATLLRTIFK